MSQKSVSGSLNPRATAFALIPAILCPFAFLFQFGFSVGTINAIGENLKRFYNESFQERFNESITKTELDLLWPLTTASFSIGGAMGTFLVGPLVSRFGQLKTLFYVQIFCLVGTLLLFLSVYMHSHEAIIIGEMLNGAYCSIGSSVAPIYVRGITLPRLRGTVGGFFAVFLVTGIISGNTFGLKQLLGTDGGWPFLLAITAFPNLIFLGYYRWMPENPRTVYEKTRNEEATSDLLTRLYGTNNVQEFIDEYKAETRLKTKTMTLWEILTTRYTRWQMFSASIVISSIQITGINGVMYNLNNILILAGVDREITPYVSIANAAVQIIAALLVAGFMARRQCGRKTIFFMGNIMLGISCVIYTLSVAFQHTASWVSYISIVSTLSYAIGLNAGSGVIAFAWAPELLTESARAVGMSVAVFCLWLGFVLVSFCTPFFFEYLKFGALLPYLGVVILLILYVYFVIPETRDMKGPEIDKFFQRRSRGCCSKNVEMDPEVEADSNQEKILN